MYYLKLIVGALLSPLFVAALLALLTGAAVLFRYRRLSKLLGVGAFCIAYLGSIAVVGDALLGPLERQFSAIDLDARSEKPRYVVVLGSGYAPRREVPVTGALDSEGLARVVEGVRIMHALDNAKLVVSGGALAGSSPSAVGYSLLARDLGVPSSSILILSDSLDTAAESKAIAAVVGDAPLVLVTSASHLPRAMLLMKRRGLNPIPAPTAHHVNELSPIDLRDFLPSASSLRKTELALHEYAGLTAIHFGLN